MTLRTSLAVLAVALVALPGCAGGKNAADKQFEELHQEITRLQQEQDRVSERLAGLESKGAAEGKRATRPGERPPLDVVVLRPEAEPSSEGEPAEVVDDDGAARPEVRLGREGKGKKAKGEIAKDAEREYESALSMVKKKSYAKAVDAFTGFLVKYPDHSKADNALFWMGEALLGQGDDARALDQFEAVIARFPDGNKAPDALLKIALIKKKQGETDKAKEALSRLRSRYPQSDAAKRAPKEQ
jgi:tol-pal system protein YbgF